MKIALSRVVGAVLGALVLGGCGAETHLGKSTPPAPSSSPPDTTSPTASSTASPSTAEPAPLSSDGRPMRGELSIPAIGLTDLEVVPYRGWTDDAPGTEIQTTA